MTNRVKQRKNFYLEFLGVLTKQGKKIAAKKILDHTFNLVSLQTKISSTVAFIKLFKALNTFVEVKRIKIRRTTHVVPFPISYNRRLYLIIKWLRDAALADTRKVSFSKKLSFEIINILKNKNSKALLQKKQNIGDALKNKSNLHFRW